MHKILVHAQDSCACTTLLCMHKTLAHALEGTGPKAAGTQQKSSRWSGPGRLLFVWVPALVPGPPPSACTRVLCMHKSVVHAQECCACTRILCMHKHLGPKNKPLLLGRCAASGGFCFLEKKVYEKTIMRNYEKIIHLCVFLRKLIKPGPPLPPPHSLAH